MSIGAPTPEYHAFEKNPRAYLDEWITNEFKLFPGLDKLDKIVFVPYSFSNRDKIKGSITERGMALLAYKPSGMILEEMAEPIEPTGAFGPHSSILETNAHIVMTNHKGTFSEIQIIAGKNGNPTSVIEIGKLHDPSKSLDEQLVVYTNCSITGEQVSRNEFGNTQTILNGIGFMTPDRKHIAYFSPTFDKSQGKLNSTVTKKNDIDHAVMQFDKELESNEYCIAHFEFGRNKFTLPLPISVLPPPKTA